MASPVPNMAVLIYESLTQGFDMVQRLIDDYASGANCFDQTSEALFSESHACYAVREITQPALCKKRAVLKHHMGGIGRG